MESIAKISHVEVIDFKGGDGEVVRLAYGRIKDDKSTHGNHPFPDGSAIRTSPIKEIVEENGVKYIVTLNSIYEVIGDIN